MLWCLGYPKCNGIVLNFRNTRKKLSKKPLAREQVKTVSKYDLQHSEKRKEMIAGSKRRAKKKRDKEAD